MKILVFGDIVGRMGREAVQEYLSRYRHEYDLVIANGENAAGGFGLTNKVADELFSKGVNVITSGNHIWDKRDIVYYMNKEVSLLRPLNYGKTLPGKGYVIVNVAGKRVCILNLQGRVFMPPIDCPFQEMERFLQEHAGEYDILIVDFHAEATSEKIAMGHFLAGKASLVYGTHTHVQTSDAKILKNYTGYLTDAGMCGSFSGVLGMKKEPIIQRFFDNLPTRFEVEESDRGMNGIAVTLDEQGACQEILPLSLYHL